MRKGIYMRFPEGKNKAFTMSYDDGVEQDIRLIDIMKKKGLKGTFNLNSGCYSPKGTVFEPGRVHRRMDEERVTKLYGESGMEVAVHGLTHPSFTDLSPAICNNDILQDRINLEKQFGCFVRGAAYPYGTFNDAVVDILKANEIVYCRTVWSSNNFDIPTDWLRLRPTCHHDDPKLEELTERFLNKPAWDEKPWLFYLWGHSYEFEEHNNWERIESFTDKISGHEDVWYATNIEIYDYCEAYKQLRFTVEEKLCYNPTCTTLWFEADGKTYKVEPGQTVEL